jgi:hypothetical protein
LLKIQFIFPQTSDIFFKFLGNSFQKTAFFALDLETFLYCCSFDDGYTCDTCSKVKPRESINRFRRWTIWRGVFREAKSFDRLFKNSVFLYNLLKMKKFVKFTIQFREFAEFFRHRRWQFSQNCLERRNINILMKNENLHIFTSIFFVYYLIFSEVKNFHFPSKLSHWKSSFDSGVCQRKQLVPPYWLKTRLPMTTN